MDITLEKFLGSFPVLAIVLLAMATPHQASAQSLVVGDCGGTPTANFMVGESVCVSGTTGGVADSDDALVCVVPLSGGGPANDVTPDGCNTFPPMTTISNESVWSPPTEPGGYIVVLFASNEDVIQQQIAILRSKPNDHDGDRKSDILWRNSSTGENWMFLMNAATIATTLGVTTVPNPTVWKVAGNGDYNGDGNADILWRDEVTGQNHMYLMDGPTVSSSVSVTTVPNPGVWKVVGNGDYDGDGRADIFWRNTVTGQNHMHLMNGGTITSSLSVTTVPDPDNWKVAGNGDYDGDGKSDILWRHATTGQNHMYLMDSSTVAGSLSVTTVPDPDNWQVAAGGDYNADGKSDILWRNAATGQNHMYLMDGAMVASSLSVTTVPSPDDWKVVGSGDYNGDNKSDIFWRNISTGQNWMYLMNSNTISSSLEVTTVSDTIWEVVVTP
jgi:hypothetical protein